MPHDTDFAHEHEALSEADRLEMARYIWSQETVELRTIGIDVGSSTSHLLFAKVVLQRQTQALSSRFVVVNREVLWRSPIMLTPFLPNGTIDAEKLGDFIHGAYHDAGVRRAEVDTGAVILTGEAIKRKNARAIDELFAHEAGKFVCATAGHRLECTLAAHGSGAVKLSKQRDACILHIDIGGGTTKLALIDRGLILGVSAFAVGGRLLAQQDGAWTRVDESAQLVAAELGLSVNPQSLADARNREAIARRLAEVAVNKILGVPDDPLGRQLQLTGDLPRASAPSLLTFSGGVSEYIFREEDQEYGDIAKLLATSLTEQLAARSSLPLVDPGHRIRATVIGASQFTAQVSGKTIYLPEQAELPMRNVPVVHVDWNGTGPVPVETVSAAIRRKIAQLDVRREAALAIAFTWGGDPEYSRLRDMAQAIRQALAPSGERRNPLFLMIDGDIGRSIGHLLDEQLKPRGNVISIDGVQLQDLDFVDVGELISPPGVVPIVIKSLLFS